MPRGPFEWSVCLLSAAVVSTIAGFYALGRNDQAALSPEPPRRVAHVAGIAASLQPVTDRAEPAEPPPVARRSTFAIRATAGDAWLSVRSGSEAGQILFEGTLGRGKALRLVRSGRLWIRFGAAAYIGLSIDGRPVRLPLFGTFDAYAGPRGVRPDRTVYATAAQSP